MSRASDFFKSGDGIVNTVDMADEAITPAKMSGTYARKNYIINGDFKVWQRGDCTTPTAMVNGEYLADRFAPVISGITGTMTDVGQRIRLDATSSALGTIRITQRIEHPEYYAGKTVTLSCVMKSNTANARLLIYADNAYLSETTTHTGGGEDETLSVTVTLPADLSQNLECQAGVDGALSANISIVSGDYVEITQLQLEEGSEASDFEFRTYAEELALCQRYYQRYNWPSTGVRAFDGIFISSTSFVFETKIAPIRTTPEIYYSSIELRERGITVRGISNFTELHILGHDRISLTATVVSATAGESGHIRGLSTSSYLAFDSEL